MNDYRLDRLSPRLFEHMVQGLAMKAVTSAVTPFGDGPDGGREATFDGRTNYGSTNEPWHGYGIIQAKYRNRTQDPRRDAAWACNELRKELRQYTRQRNPRPAPEYFIFATNVVLSPASNGGKEAVLAILKDFAQKYGLKDVDVWDYDKIRVLLDSDEEIRHSYMAWILPSDVIAELCKSLGRRRSDYYKVIVRYLQRELLADQYAQLEQAGHSADEAIPLAQVFIDLPTALRPVPMDEPYFQHDESPRFVERVIVESGYSMRASLSEVGVDNPVATRAGRRQRGLGRYVLIGGPGQGKTTIAQYICQIFRCALLSDVSPDLLDSRAEDIIQDLLDQMRKDEQSIPTARRLPFRIVLSEFARSLASGDAESLMGYLAMRLCANSDIKISAEEVEKVLSDYPSIIILDGLDEVPASTNRDEVLSAVSNFSIDIATGKLDVFLIATTRPQGYNDEFSPRQYTHHFLTPLANADALNYGTRLASSRFGSNEERFGRVTGRLQRALTKPATARLMKTPLQVTILTLLVDRLGDPPEERWSLFREYYHLIYQRETERDIPSVAVLKEHRVDVDVIHRRVGIALQVESERSGGTDARLTVDQFGHLVEDYLKEEGHSGKHLLLLKKQIIDAAAYRLVFLVGLESGQVGFEIRSLQEFMAAEAIIDGEDVTARERLRAIASSSHWRNVFLFSAGKCFTDRRHMRDTIQAICAELNDDPHDDSLRVLRVGSELALDLLEDGPARKTPFTRETLTRLAIQLLETPFRDVFRVAAICVEETRHLFEEYLRGELLSNYAPRPSSAWQCLAILIDRFGDEFERLGREVLHAAPMTERELVLAAHYATGRNEWLSQALFRAFCSYGPVLGLESGDEEADHDDQEWAYGPWASPGYPRWLSWYSRYSAMQHTIRHSAGLRVQLSGNAVYYSPFQRVLPEHNDALIPPSGIPDGECWEITRSVGRFCQAPDAGRLADAVRSVMAHGTPAFWHGLRLLQMPWPLAETLLAKQADASAPLESIVEDGRYGDVGDWIYAERKFLKGVALEEITEQERICATADGGYYPFPYRCMGLFSEVRSPRSSTPSSLIKMLDASDSTLIRAFLGEIAITLHMQLRAPGKERDAEWVDRAAYAMHQRSSYVSPIFYDLMENLELEQPIWSDLFSKYPVTVLEPSPRFDFSKRQTLRLWHILDLHPELRGLLVLLAVGLMSARAPMKDFPLHLPALSSSDSITVRTAALVVNLVAGATISDVADEIVSVTTAERRAARIVASALSRRMTSYSKECHDIMELMRLCDRGTLSLWDHLHRNFSRRRTQLLTQGVWDRLAFPSELRTILNDR